MKSNLQASNNTKSQFANSPTLSKEIMNAVMGALAVHTTMRKQAIDSQGVREGLKDVLLGRGSKSRRNYCMNLGIRLRIGSYSLPVEVKRE